MRLPSGPVANPVPHAASGTLRIAAAADLHFTSRSAGAHQHWLARVDECADVLLLCGDLTEHGLPEEAELLAEELSSLATPVLAVLGNHDLEAGAAHDVRRILERAGVVVLDGDAVELAGVGFAGVMGAAGGFARETRAGLAEREARKLERALAELRTARKVALMHYAPTLDTLRGEPEHLLPMLGCAALGEPLARFEVDAVFHGHAHRGVPSARTAFGFTAYNAALPVLRRYGDSLRPFHTLTLPAPPARGSCLSLGGLAPCRTAPAVCC